MNNREIAKLTQKIIEFKVELHKLKNPKEIKKIKYQIMFLVQEINAIEIKTLESKILIDELTTTKIVTL